ncbi:MAG: aspartate/glutamate racemase family protein, partial [Acetobacteraceae bacterium]
MATARLYLDICRLVLATNRVTPAIMIDSVRMPRVMEEAFVANVPCSERENELLGIVRAAIMRLAAAGANAVCAACNTVQPAFLSEAARCQVRPIGIVDAALAGVRRAGCRSALVLGSASARRRDVYGAAARALGISTTYPTDSEQAEVSRAILELTHERVTDSVIATITSVCRRHERGTDCVLLGCTDLSQVRDEPLGAYPVIDSLSELSVAGAAFLR